MGGGHKEHAKYLAILPQMGMTPESVPDELRGQIYEKLGLNPEEGGKKATKHVIKDISTLKKMEAKRSLKRQQARHERDSQDKLASLKESELLLAAEGIGGNERISMGDILGCIDADKFEKADDKPVKSKSKSNETVNATKLRK